MILSEKLNEFLNIFFEGKTFDTNEICKGGSDRKFYRVSNENKSCILSISSDLAEYRYYSSFANYFQKQNVPVPEFYFTIPEEGTAVMFDAGTESLCDYTKKHSDGENFTIYSKVLDKLFSFQEMDFSSCLELSERQFDYDALLWETSYFSQFFSPQVGHFTVGAFLVKQPPPDTASSCSSLSSTPSALARSSNSFVLLQLSIFLICSSVNPFNNSSLIVITP